MRPVPTPRPPVLAALLAAAAAIGASCASTGADPAWTGEEYEVPSDRLLWEYSLLALEKSGYPLGAGVDPIEMRVRTGWITQLSPFKDRGSRRRAHLRILPADEPDALLVEARVEVQRNAALVRPTDPRYADWKEEPDDPSAARLLLQHIHAYVGTPLELAE